MGREWNRAGEGGNWACEVDRNHSRGYCIILFSFLSLISWGQIGTSLSSPIAAAGAYPRLISSNLSSQTVYSSAVSALLQCSVEN